MTHYGHSREHVIAALERTAGNLCQAERLLGYSPNKGKTLRRRMRDLGVQRSVTRDGLLLVTVNN